MSVTHVYASGSDLESVYRDAIRLKQALDNCRRAKQVQKLLGSFRDGTYRDRSRDFPTLSLRFSDALQHYSARKEQRVVLFVRIPSVGTPDQGVNIPSNGNAKQLASNHRWR